MTNPTAPRVTNTAPRGPGGPLLLAADIGGTKANLALFRHTGGRLAPVREATVPTGSAPGPEALLAAFLGSQGKAVGAACVAVAGPVRRGRTVAPNLPWDVSAPDLSAALGIPALTLLNDVAATAVGIGELPPEGVAVLQEGTPDPAGVVGVIAPGTGLGAAFLLPCGGRGVPMASEGGHAGFAPRGDLEVELHRFLEAEFGEVSAERVVSGPGLRNVYRFLTATRRVPESPRVRARMGAEDPSAVISEEALAGTDEACARALELWVRAFGSHAGNLALTGLATGGFYLAGGIVPKILPAIRRGGFLEAFRAKGRLAGLLTHIPVRVVLDPKTALFGAARCAARRLAQAPP